MIRPLPRAIMHGKTRRLVSIGPFRFTSTERHQASGAVSAKASKKSDRVWYQKIKIAVVKYTSVALLFFYILCFLFRAATARCRRV
jgi:hypothetical protein